MISEEEVGIGRKKWDRKTEVGREDRSGDEKKEANMARAALTGGLVAVAGRTPIAVEPDGTRGGKLS